MDFKRELIKTVHSDVHLIFYDDFDPLMYLDQLTSIEQERFFSFQHNFRRREFVATRILRHELFGFEHIHYNEYGAPYIKSEGYISISHTRGVAGIAFGTQFELGLDLEKPGEKALKVSHKFLSEIEQSTLDTTCATQMTQSWCAKESLYKLSGQRGLDFRKNISLEPLGNGIFLGEVRDDYRIRQTEIHTFVNENYILSINDSPLTNV